MNSTIMRHNYGARHYTRINYPMTFKMRSLFFGQPIIKTVNWQLMA
ncbi:MAG: hypothetical protein AAFR63_16750 [Cyanobacteria bacterium J06631_6]